VIEKTTDKKVFLMAKRMETTNHLSGRTLKNIKQQVKGNVLHEYNLRHDLTSGTEKRENSLYKKGH